MAGPAPPHCTGLIQQRRRLEPTPRGRPSLSGTVELHQELRGTMGNYGLRPDCCRSSGVWS